MPIPPHKYDKLVILRAKSRENTWRWIGSPLIALLMAMTSGKAVAGVQLSEFSTGKKVEPKALEAEVIKHWVQAKTDGNESFSFWDIELSSNEKSSVILGTNSVYIYALTVSGEIKAGSVSAKPGEVMIWNHMGSDKKRPGIHVYSAERLLEAYKSSGVEPEGELEVLAAKQKRRQFWGLLRATEFNLAKPMPAEVEGIRQIYQTRPEIIGLKRSSRSVAEYKLNTVRAFLTALKSGDANTVGLLLGPSLFLEGASALEVKNLLLVERAAFAKSLISNGEFKEANPDTVRLDKKETYEAVIGSKTCLIEIEVFDDAVYISSLKFK